MIIDALATEEDLQSFLELPRSIYRDDPYYIAEPLAKTRASLLRERFAERQRALLWRSGKRTLARTVVRISPVLVDENHAPVGMLGFFEAVEAPNEVGQLLTTGVDWLMKRGVRTIVGPMDGDTWHRYRFNLGQFRQPPFLMEPYNRPYYGDLWQRAGFEPLENYYSTRIEDIEAAAAGLARIHDDVLDRGYRLRPLVMDRFEEEIEIIYRISTQIFAGNFLYEEISLADFLALYRPVRSLIDPTLVLIAETSAGEAVGFLFAMVDYHRAVSAMRGKDGPLAKLRFMLNRRTADAVNMKTVGVLADHRRFGVAGALTWRCYHAILQRGIRRANLCLIREGNPSGRLDSNKGTVSRRYVLYQYAGEPR